MAAYKSIAAAPLTQMVNTRLPAESDGATVATVCCAVPCIAADCATVCVTVSARGTKLTVLSKENGHKSRKATNAHRRQAIHFGARFKIGRRAKTASIKKLAVKLKCIRFCKKTSTAISPTATDYSFAASIIC